MAQGQKKSTLTIFVIPLLFIFQQLASAMGRFVAGIFTYDRIDKDGVFAWISIHHIVQMLLALVVIWIIMRILKLDFGIRFGNSKIGLEYTAIFGAVILIYVLVSYGISYANNSIQAYEYPLNAKNVIGTLGFQLLLSGISEEILFRVLPITLLVYSFGSSRIIKIWKLHVSLETILAAFLFSLAHINWTLNPLTVSVSWFQLIYAFILGLCYGAVYQKTKSVVYPMVMHSLSNVLMIGVGYIFASFFNEQYKHTGI